MQMLIPNLSGNYSVEITQGECQIVSDCVEYQFVSLSSLPIESKIIIHPNPVENMLEIEIKQLSSSVKYQFFDTKGGLLKDGVLDKPQTRIDLSDYAIGVYFLRIQNENQSWINKLIKI